MSDKKIKLKKCPFCGGEAEIIDGYADTGCWVQCKVCHSTSWAEEQSHDEVAKLWNKRDETFFERFLNNAGNQEIYLKEKAKVEFLTLQKEQKEERKLSESRMKELIAIDKLCKKHLEIETECVLDSVKIVLAKLEKETWR